MTKIYIFVFQRFCGKKKFALEKKNRIPNFHEFFFLQSIP